MKCRLCDRTAEGEFCPYHAAALGAVRSAYPAWRKAYGSLSYSEFLERVSRNRETGRWAVEAARLLISEEGRTPQETSV